MKEFSTEQVQSAFEKLPQELKDAISSADVMGKIRDIGNRHNLHIDQIGELVDQVGLVMLGLKRSSDFVHDASTKLGIGSADAQAIANDINSEVFSAIKTNMREIEEEEKEVAHDVSSIEKAGGFSVEPSLASSSADGKEQNNHDINEHDREGILSDIENPQPAPMTSEPNHYEPLVDHLLTSPSAKAEQKIEHKTEEPPVNLPITEKPIPVTAQPVAQKPTPTPPPKPAPQPKKGSDPYRESVN